MTSILYKLSAALWANSLTICLSYFLFVNIAYASLFFLKMDGLIGAVIAQMLCFPAGILFSSIWRVFFDLQGFPYLGFRVIVSSITNTIGLMLLLYYLHRLIKRFV